MDGRSFAIPQTMDEIFNDFKGRRAGLIKAFSNDVLEFHSQFAPERGDLYLLGLPDGTWKIVEPFEVVALKIPKPMIGLNCVRDKPGNMDWLSYVAVCSESWLRSVALYFGIQAGFDENERVMIRDLIKSLPTIRSVVEEAADQQGVAKKPRLR